MTRRRKLVVGAVLLWVLGVVCTAQAEAPRVSVSSIQCIGFPAGTSRGHVEGYVYMATTQFKYRVVGDCEFHPGTTNFGFGTFTIPDISVEAGPVTSIVLHIVAQRFGDARGWHDSAHSVQVSNGFFSGTFMADPATATGEVHVLISVP